MCRILLVVRLLCVRAPSKRADVVPGEICRKLPKVVLTLLFKLANANINLKDLTFLKHILRATHIQKAPSPELW